MLILIIKSEQVCLRIYLNTVVCFNFNFDICKTGSCVIFTSIFMLIFKVCIVLRISIILIFMNIYDFQFYRYPRKNWYRSCLSNIQSKNHAWYAKLIKTINIQTNIHLKIDRIRVYYILSFILVCICIKLLTMLQIME